MRYRVQIARNPEFAAVVVDQARDPSRRQAAMCQGEGQRLAANRHDRGVVVVGIVDGRHGDGVARGVGAQTAHSESPTSAENGPVSS